MCTIDEFSTLLASITVIRDRFLRLLIRNLKRLLYWLVTTDQRTELFIDNCQTQIDKSKCTRMVYLSFSWDRKPYSSTVTACWIFHSLIVRYKARGFWVDLYAANFTSSHHRQLQLQPVITGLQKRNYRHASAVCLQRKWKSSAENAPQTTTTSTGNHEVYTLME